MIVALDYDDTYTRDPGLWDLFIAQAKARGHMVVCATMRYRAEGKDVYNDLTGKVDQIIFTGRKAKYKYVTEQLGVPPSVWIDDNPLLILMDAVQPKEDDSWIKKS